MLASRWIVASRVNNLMKLTKVAVVEVFVATKWRKAGAATNGGVFVDEEVAGWRGCRSSWLLARHERRCWTLGFGGSAREKQIVDGASISLQ